MAQTKPCSFVSANAERLLKSLGGFRDEESQLCDVGYGSYPAFS